MIKNEYRDISALKNWNKNPRSIKDRDFARLKIQIQALGQYKPLIITEDGTVLGGNMRLRAYKDLGIKKIWVSIVEAPDEETKLEYALSDNDRSGFYDSEQMANLTGEFQAFPWEEYAVDFNEPKIVADFIPDLEAAKDKKDKKKKKCPNCGFEY